MYGYSCTNYFDDRTHRARLSKWPCSDPPYDRIGSRSFFPSHRHQIKFAVVLLDRRARKHRTRAEVSPRSLIFKSGVGKTHRTRRPCAWRHSRMVMGRRSRLKLPLRIKSKLIPSRMTSRSMRIQSALVRMATSPSGKLKPLVRNYSTDLEHHRRCCRGPAILFHRLLQHRKRVVAEQWRRRTSSSATDGVGAERSATASSTPIPRTGLAASARHDQPTEDLFRVLSGRLPAHLQTSE